MSEAKQNRDKTRGPQKLKNCSLYCFPHGELAQIRPQSRNEIRKEGYEIRRKEHYEEEEGMTVGCKRDTGTISAETPGGVHPAWRLSAQTNEIGNSWKRN